MPTKFQLLTPCIVAVLVTCPLATFGQTFPVKPIRIVAAEAGGSADLIARVIAAGVAANLGQPVIVDNRASSVVGEIVAKAPPDGYTLVLNGAGFWLSALLESKMNYDAVKDFSPITSVASIPNIIVVHPSLPVRTVKELIALAKGKPGELNYASGVIGSSTHLSAELFKAMAGINLVRIPYRGNGPALSGLLAGQVEIMFPNAGTAVPHFKSGKLKALAVTSLQRSMLAPDLPSVAASGLPGYESIALIGIFAPAKTPTAVVGRLNREIVQVLNAEDAKEKLINSGVEPVTGTPEQLASGVAADIAKWGKLIKDKGIRAE